MKLNLARLAIVLVMLTGFAGFKMAFTEGGIHEVFNMVLNDADTNIGIRADIGGSFIAMTLFMLMGLIKTDARWIWPAVIALTCIMTVRIFGVTQYGYTDAQGIIIGIEVVMISLLCFGAIIFRSIHIR